MSSNWPQQPAAYPYARQLSPFGPLGTDSPAPRPSPPVDHTQRWVRRTGLFGWWFDLTAPRRPAGVLPVMREEWLRRAEVTSYMILFVYAAILALIANSLASATTAYAIVFMSVGLIVAAFCNRVGWTGVAAYFVPGLVAVVIMLSLVGSTGLQLIGLPIYDLFVIPIIIAGVTGGRVAPWVLYFVAAAFILLDFNFQPHALITAVTGSGVRIILMISPMRCASMASMELLTDHSLLEHS